MAEPDQEQLARELEEQLMSLRVEDVLVQSLVTVSSIGFRRLGVTPDTKGDRDLVQSQLAIAVIEALTPVLEGFLPAQLASDFKGSGSQLKLAYARAVSEEGGAPATEQPAGAEAAAATTPEPPVTEEPSATEEPAANEEPAATEEPAASQEPDAPADETGPGDPAENDDAARRDE